jgi:hypothetical protein
MSNDAAPVPNAGWYADPANPGTNRYWTGQTWTESDQASVASRLTPAAFRNSTGTWAFVLGLVALVLFWVPVLYLITSIAGGIVAIILAVRARRACAQGLASNRSMATAGLVLGIIGLSLAGLSMIVGMVLGAAGAIS